MRPEHARVVGDGMIGDHLVRLEYWPRARAREVIGSDFDQHPDMPLLDGFWYEPGFDQQLRGYSYRADWGRMAVVFVDARETYESATFVALHELAHLLVDDDDDDEIHADLIASMMMRDLGLPQRVLEALPAPRPVVTGAGVAYLQ